MGIDPGGTTGWCLLEFETKKILTFGAVKELDFTDWLLTWTAETANWVVVEDFIVRPDYSTERESSTMWIPVPVAKQIGEIRFRCMQLGIRYHEQQPSDKPAGYKLAKLKYVPGKKGTHIQDAVAHATFFAVNGRKKPKWQ